MVAGGCCLSNPRRSRAREIARSGANERGRRGDSIPYITYRGDASWWSNFTTEEGSGGSVPCGGVSARGWRLVGEHVARLQGLPRRAGGQREGRNV
jgi:hypothetical protein